MHQRQRYEVVEAHLALAHTLLAAVEQRAYGDSQLPLLVALAEELLLQVGQPPAGGDAVSGSTQGRVQRSLPVAHILCRPLVDSNQHAAHVLSQGTHLLCTSSDSPRWPMSAHFSASCRLSSRSVSSTG